MKPTRYMAAIVRVLGRIIRHRNMRIVALFGIALLDFLKYIDENPGKEIWSEGVVYGVSKS